MIRSISLSFSLSLSPSLSLSFSLIVCRNTLHHSLMRKKKHPYLLLHFFPTRPRHVCSVLLAREGNPNAFIHRQTNTPAHTHIFTILGSIAVENLKAINKYINIYRQRVFFCNQLRLIIFKSPQSLFSLLIQNQISALFLKEQRFLQQVKINHWRQSYLSVISLGLLYCLNLNTF